MVILSSTVFVKVEIAIVIRFPSSFGLWWINMMGVSMDRKVVGTNSSSGLENCSNIFMFMAGWVTVLFF